ncbi:MAG: EAL domain-containing protein [Planctomycetes bacterium]|nr:EAL domain-containing protein [Planctomycetota bacterium]
MTGPDAPRGRHGRARRARLRRRFAAFVGRCRTRTLRVTLGTRILFVLIGLATVTTALTVALVEGSLAQDLQQASRARLRHAAQSVSLWLDERLAAQADRYRAAAASPQLLANVETRHAPTLQRFAADLQPLHGAQAIVFLAADGTVVAGAGPAALQTARGNGVFAWQGTACTSTRVPIGDGSVGSLLAIETLAADDLDGWSAHCQAHVELGPPGPADDLVLPVRAIGDDLELRVATTFAAEHAALLRSRANVLTGGLLGLALALAASLVLARSLVRPIRAIQRAAQRIAAGRFDVRLDDRRSDEVGDVARAFHHMLDNLQRNIDERARANDTMRHLAFHDGLTGLPNRRLFRTRLANALDRVQKGGPPLAVLSLDLDRFKDVNDTLGQAAGDSLLLEVACRLHGCIAPQLANGNALLARLGADEFALLWLDGAEPAALTTLATRLLANLDRPIDVSGQEVSVGVSIGIAIAPQDGLDGETLLRDASLAMSHQKQTGGRGFAFFADSMHGVAGHRLQLETRLRRALANGEFQVHYQPKLELATDRITGMEALVRWQEPDGTMIPPGEFLPLAEATGVIVPLGEWVLRTAAAQSVAWQLEGLPPIRMAVNVSARQLEHRDDFVGTVQAVLDATGLEPSLLELEITESSMLQDAEATVAQLERVRALGVALALDDFGTGYSSFAYLRRLPIDTLKVDRSFVEEADADPEDAALVGAILAMARVLSLRVVVEGVETKRQRRFLEHLGCDEIQGYLVSRPVPADAAAALLRPQGRKRRGARKLAGT